MNDNTIPNLLADENSNVSLIVDKLLNHGFTHEYFWIEGESYSRFQKAGYNAWLTRNAHLSYPMTNPVVSYVCKHKHLSYEYAERLHITTPQTVKISLDDGADTAELTNLLDNCKKLVVKPADLAKSTGLTVNITTSAQLEKAITYAQEQSDSVLVQQQVTGDEIRFMIFKGEATAALLRQTPRLRGDGMSTVSDLFKQENIERQAISDTLVAYPQLPESLVANLTPTSVPKKDEIIPLSQSTLISGGASVYEVINQVHISYIEIAEKIAKHIGAEFIVIDLMIHDYTLPSTDKNYALIEFNELPSLKLCYSCRDGQHYDVLSDLIPMVIDTLKH